jgi:hypothetical protein
MISTREERSPLKSRRVAAAAAAAAQLPVV